MSTKTVEENFNLYIENMGAYFGADTPEDWNHEELTEFFTNISEYYWEESKPEQVGETPDDCVFTPTEHGQALAIGRDRMFAELLAATEGKTEPSNEDVDRLLRAMLA